MNIEELNDTTLDLIRDIQEQRQDADEVRQLKVVKANAEFIAEMKELDREFYSLLLMHTYTAASLAVKDNT
jgi:hypothetical protein